METKVEEPRIDPKYEIDIFWSDEDDAFIAIVPELPYCSAWGETYEEALEEVRVAIRGHLRVAEKYGYPIPEPKHHHDAREAAPQEAGRASQQQATGQIAEDPTGPVRQASHNLADSTVALQEINLRLTQDFFRNFMEQLRSQTQGMGEAAQNLREQGRLQREALETLSQEATNAYSEFLNSALSFYQETLSTATQVAIGNTQQDAQATQQDVPTGVQAASRAGQQAMEAADQAGQQGAEAARQSAQGAEQATRESGRSYRSSR